jgi:hypothetical protein
LASAESLSCGRRTFAKIAAQLPVSDTAAPGSAAVVFLGRQAIIDRVPCRRKEARDAASLTRSRAMVTHAIDRHRWNEIADSPTKRSEARQL